MYPKYIRDKAVQMRVEKNLSIDEIAERLALPKTTIYYWVKDIPLGRPRRWSTGQRKGNGKMRLDYKLRRDEAYAAGLAEYDDLARDPTFRDFLCLYLAEGYKRNRNRVSVGNSDPAIVKLCATWVGRLSRRKVTYSVQYHADQDLEELKRFWASVVGVTPGEISTQRKSNSNQLAKRTWRSRFGVLTICTGDTYFRARLQAWMDRLRASWA